MTYCTEKSCANVAMRRSRCGYHSQRPAKEVETLKAIATADGKSDYGIEIVPQNLADRIEQMRRGGSRWK